MILVRLTGGLGNQLFQYAFAKQLAVSNNTQLKLDLSLLGNVNKKNTFSVFRKFELDGFEMPIFLASPREINYFNPPGKTLFSRLKRKLVVSGSKRNIIQQGNEFSEAYLCTGDNHCIVGRWQSEDYFSGIVKELKKELRFKQQLGSSNAYYNAIVQSTAVGIHVRRGDYVSNRLYAEGIGALDTGYYKAGIDYLKKRCNNLRFFVFSDDINWCKMHFKNEELVFVEQTNEFTHPLYDMQLISLCKHQIISNSTFSWWGAWLSEQADSVIIAPEKWARSKTYEPERIVPARWVKISNQFETIIA